MKLALTILGALAALFGFIWLLQGAGIIRYPAESFMIDQTPWIWRGGAVCVAGLGLVWYARRR